MSIEERFDIVVTPFVTPFKDGMLDIEGQRSVVRNSRANGITWEFYLGRNGEDRFLTDDDCKRVTESASGMMSMEFTPWLASRDRLSEEHQT